MRVALVNVVYKKGSTGNIVADLKREYLKDGHDVYVLYGRGKKVNEAKVYKTGYEFESKVHHAFSRVTENLYGGMFFSTLRLKRYLKKINPDVVHLHCINGFFVNIYSIIKFLKKRNVKVILTNHADFMFTANCGISLDCKKWKTAECRKCEHVKEFNGKYSVTHRTHHFFKKMKRAFKGAKNFVITGVSPALCEMMEESPIFKDIPVLSVNNGFNISDFSFISDKDPYIDIRKDEKTKIVLHVTSGFHLRDKGGFFLYDIAKKYQRQNVKFVVIGNMKNEKDTENITFLGRIEKKEDLLAHYRHADATILLSQYETFSMVIAESLLMGTRVVSFLSGGPESVAPLEYTKFVEYGDLDKFVKELDATLDTEVDKDKVISTAQRTYDISYTKNNYEILFEDKGNEKKNSSIHRMRDSSSNLFKKKYSSLLLGIGLFVLYLLTTLSSIIPALYAGTTAGVIYRIAVLIVFGLSVLILAILSKSRPRTMFLVLLSIYVITGIVISFVAPAEMYGTEITILSRLSNLARTLGVAVFAFGFIEVFPSLFKKKEAIRYFGLLVAAFAFVAIIYSFVFQHDVIINSFLAEGEDAHFFQVKSFFESKNAYGFVLLLGMIGTTYGMIGSSKWKAYSLLVFDVFLFLNLVISRDKSALLIAVIMIIAALLFIFIKTYKRHFKRNTIIGVVILFLMAAFVVFMSVPALHPEGTTLGTMHHYFYQNFILNGIRTFGTRFEDFSASAPMFNDYRIIFGYGEQFVYIQYAHFTNLSSIDNAYIATILSGGIIKAVLMLYIYCLLLSKIVLLFFHDKKKALFVVMLTVAFVLQGMTESIYFLTTSSAAIFIYAFTYLLAAAEIGSSRRSYEKRVLHVTGSFKKGGTEAFVLGYLKLLKSKGITVDIYTFGEVDKTQEEKFELYGGRIYRGHAPSKKGYFKAYVDFWKFLIKHDRYIAIHGNANFDNALYLRIAKDFLIENRVFHAHDTLSGIEFSKKEKAIMSYKRFLSKINANHFVACSYEAGYDIVGQHYFDEYGSVIKNIVESNRFLDVDLQDAESLKKQYKIPENAFIIGNISRFEEKKNQGFIIDVFEKIAKQKPEAILVLGGPDGGIEQEIRDKVSSLNLTNKVRFIGPRNDVALWLRVFDLYLFPSKFEGFGIVVLENQIASLHTIASDNVPRLVDMNLGLVDFLSLDNVDKWVHFSLTVKKKEIPSVEMIEALKRNGFEPEENLNSLLNLYIN